jgi:hypothetical protein
MLGGRCMKNSALMFGTFAVFSLASACTDVDLPGDAADDTALDGKADGQYSQCQLDAIVTWLNGPLTAVDMIDAGVNTRAARKLAAHRDGADKMFGTADDNAYDTIAEVDAVPYVGPATFKQLALASGDSCTVNNDPFDPASCQGPAITQQGATALLAGHYGYGAKNAVSSYEVLMRTRSCSSASDDTTCGAWSTPKRATPISTAGSHYYGGEVGTASFQDLQSSVPQVGLLLQGFLVADPTWHGNGYWDAEILCEDVTHPASCKWTSCQSNTPRSTCGSGDYGGLALKVSSYMTSTVDFSGVVTDHCARLTARPSFGLWNLQVEAAVLVRY